MNDKIDFVITWVDGSDEKWLEEKRKYEDRKNFKSDTRDCRYRDMETLKYWFRCVEKNADWVNKIYFVTCGHVPEWLNINNKKLVIVNHKDFIPSDKLPTFSSTTIESYFHKIKNLSENFVYFNDDIFVINKTRKDDFFKKGLPVDNFSISPIVIQTKDYFHRVMLNNVEAINRNFDFRKCLKKNLFKYLSLKNGKYLLRTLTLLNYKTLIGIHPSHLCTSFKKSTFEKVWNSERDLLEKSTSFKFRNNYDCVNQWLFEMWQLMEGNYVPRRVSFGKFVTIGNKNIRKILSSKRTKVVCLNDDDILNYEKVKREIIDCFENKFSEKSSFEK